MPIIKGNTSIGAIYKGTTQIDAIYKGTTLVYSAGTWEDWYNSFIYYALVPSTINSKSVQKKSKLDYIEGNSVVENQLVQNGNFTDFSNWATSGGNTIYSVDNNILTFKAVQRYGGVRQTLDIVAGHKYLFAWSIKMGTTPATSGTTVVATLTNVSPQESRAELNTNWQKLSLLTTASSGQTQSVLYIRDFAESSWVDNQVKDVVLFDLTLMFGTGNEPTTLTDTRIQALLNRSYIPYNIGKIKCSSVGAISSQGYNLLTLNRTQGTLSGGARTTQRLLKDNEYYVGLSDNNYYSSSNVSNVSYSSSSITLTGSGGYGIGLPIKVVAGNSYVINYTNSGTGTSGVRISWYDKNGNWVSATGNSASGTTVSAPVNAYLGVVCLRPNGEQTYTNIGFSLSSSRTGYSAYTGTNTLQLPAPISLNGVSTTHDTFAITNSGYVFTRNVGTYTFNGTETFNAGTGGYGWAMFNFVQNNGAKPNTSNNLIPNFNCNKYANATPQNITSSSVDKAISYNVSGSLLIRDTSITTATDMANAMSGVNLCYELATPQAITIPKGYLGCVDLGSLTWYVLSGYSNIFYALPSNGKPTSENTGVGNIYCNDFKTDSRANVMYGTTNKLVAIDTSGTVYIKDTNYTSASDFKTAMAGVYLYYETATTTTDIQNNLPIEIGGSVDTKWFKWKKNQLVNKSLLSNANNNAITVNTNTGYVEIDLSTFYSYSNAIYQYLISITSGHKYLIRGFSSTITGSTSTWRAQIRSATTGYVIFYGDTIWTATASDTIGILIYIASGYTANAKVSGYPQIIDLTLAFGSGNEPTDVSDPRIQYIINNGYIETDTTGTDTLVDSQVLPNLNLEVKCK